MASKQPIQPSKHKHQGPTKTFQQDGHWIVKPRKTEVLVCACGNRYIKTRAGQTMCVRCLFAAKKQK